MSVSDMYLEIFVEAFLNVPSFIIQSEISSSTQGYVEGSHIVGYEIFLHDTFLEFAFGKPSQCRLQTWFNCSVLVLFTQLCGW